MNGSIIRPVNGKFAYEDGLKPGGRLPLLWLVTQRGRVLRFTGSGIDKVLRVVSSTYTEQGKWSHTDYVLEVGTAIPVLLLAPFHGTTWSENSWDAGHLALEALTKVKVDRLEFEERVRADYPTVAARWDNAPAESPLE